MMTDRRSDIPAETPEAAQKAATAIREAAPADLPEPIDAARAFADWCNAGPALAKAAGVYVGITVRAIRDPRATS